MNWIIITTIIYLVGYVLGYFSYKLVETEVEERQWTLADRKIALVFALLSWIMVILGCLVYLSSFFDTEKNKKPVKW